MLSGYQTCKQVCHWLDAAGKRSYYSPLLLKSSRGRQEDYEAAKWLHSRIVCHALHSPQGCWEMLQGEGLAYNHHFQLIKEQIKKWDHFLGGTNLTKKPHCSNVSVAGLLLPRSPFVHGQPHTKQPLCPECAPGMVRYQQGAFRAWLEPRTHRQGERGQGNWIHIQWENPGV